MSRRRFLAVTAAAVGIGRGALAESTVSTRWTGHAMGAEASITLRGGTTTMANAGLTAALAAVRRIEGAFNLYDPGSELGQLNATGRLAPLSQDFTKLLAEIDLLHVASDGRFDPSVQTLWRPEPGQAGWARLSRTDRTLSLPADMALTFNGIAQGYATDAVAETLKAVGYRNTLIDIGELRGVGGPWHIGISDPKHGLIGTRHLTDGALATSSPRAMTLTTGTGHIIDPVDPARQPPWSSVTVEADSATRADGASTALSLVPRSEIAAVMARIPGLRRVTLVDDTGDILTVKA